MPSICRVRFFVLFFFLLIATLIAHAQSALQFVAVTPCRVADTRLPVGQFGGPTMTAGSQRDFPVPLSACNISSTALAYSLNVTVAPWEDLDYLTVWPTGQTQPFVSTINSYDGRTKANAAIVPAGANGAVSVYVTNKTDVILDIDGYFAPATTSTLAFFPLTPCRIADTRLPNGTFGGPSLQGGQQRIFPVLQSSCNIPDSALGYSLNFTVVPHGYLNYLTVWPTGQTQPYVSTLNAPTGTIVANAALVPAGQSGAITVYATEDTDLIVDTNGYFAPSNSGRDALSLYALSPCRVLDTRTAGGAFVGALPVDVLGSGCNVPGAEAYVFNATAVPSGPLGYLTLWPDAEGQPYVSTLNAADGAVTSNMAIVPTLNGDVDAYAFNQTQLIMDIFSYFAPILPLNITTTSLPDGTVNYNYSTTLTAAGGVLPYNWTLTSGSLPSGLQLNASSGVISGTPTVTGTSPFTVQVTDAETPPVNASAPLSITVNSTLSQLTITTTSLPNGTQNSSYSATLAATGGVTPYTWSISSGTLPPGLTLNASTGAITGTPSGAGVSTFNVQVTDSESPAQASVRQLSITISPAVPLSITTTSMPDGTADQPYSFQLVAIGGVYPYNWSVIAGKLPDGLTLNSSTGLISGIPTLPGPKDMTVQVMDSETPPVSASKEFTFTINPPGGGCTDPSPLSGNYAFYLNGFNSSGPWTLAGSFISDGHGNITTGVLDGNSVTGQPYTVNVSGTYCISSTGLHTLTLQGGSWGPVTFAFGLDSRGDGRLIEYDDTTGQGSRGAGELRKADSSAFNLGSLNGGWVFGMTGNIRMGGGQVARWVNVGQFTLSSGTVSNGTCDSNGGGQYQTCTFTGSVSPVDPQTGRATFNGQSNNGAYHVVVYVVNVGVALMAQADPSSSDAPIEVGWMDLQSGPFNNGSLNGNELMVYQDIHGSDGLDQSGIMLGSCDGQGNYYGIAADEDLAGTITQRPPQNGTYSVLSNGALIFNCQGGGCPVGFLFTQNKGIFIGTGSNTIFGQLGPQSGGPFSNASISGNYSGGALPPLDYVNGHNAVEVLSSDGAGTITVSGDSSDANGLEQYFGSQDSYSIAANGRGTSPDGHVIYVGSPTGFFVMAPHPDAGLEFFKK